jgi:hypothetical protein
MLAELEQACAEAERALRARQWAALSQSFANQRRLRQGVVNDLAAMGYALNTAPPEVLNRLEAVFTFRNDQLRRLTAYRNEVSSQLQRARKWKDIARSARVGMGPTPQLISRSQ